MRLENINRVTQTGCNRVALLAVWLKPVFENATGSKLYRQTLNNQDNLLIGLQEKWHINSDKITIGTIVLRTMVLGKIVKMTA
jgi:hypothetical protein